MLYLAANTLCLIDGTKQMSATPTAIRKPSTAKMLPTTIAVLLFGPEALGHGMGHTLPQSFLTEYQLHRASEQLYEFLLIEQNGALGPNPASMQEKRLLERFRVYTEVSPRNVGIVPDRKLFCTSSPFRRLRLPISGGIVPLSRLLLRFMYIKSLKFPNTAGMVPII